MAGIIGRGTIYEFPKPSIPQFDWRRNAQEKKKDFGRRTICRDFVWVCSQFRSGGARLLLLQAGSTTKGD